MRTWILLTSVGFLTGLAAICRADNSSAAPVVLHVFRRDVGYKVLPQSEPDDGIKIRHTDADLCDDLVVNIQNCDALVAAGKPNQNVVLFLDGIELPGIFGQRISPNDLLFTLRLTDTDRDAMVAILGKPDLLGSLYDTNRGMRPLDVSVGYDGGVPISTNVTGDAFRLRIIHMGWYWACILLFALALWILFGLAPELVKEGDRYSLARVQMAWWTMLVFGSFMFLWLVTGSIDTITGSAVGLLGISAATFVGAKAIPPPDETKNPPANPPVAAPKRSKFAMRLAQGLPYLPKFLGDLLGDKDGIGLHRFQNLLWTVILGIVFIVGVYKNLAMPALDPTLLGLMGVSSGTYLGYKFSR